MYDNTGIRVRKSTSSVLTTLKLSTFGNSMIPYAVQVLLWVAWQSPNEVSCVAPNSHSGQLPAERGP